MIFLVSVFFCVVFGIVVFVCRNDSEGYVFVKIGIYMKLFFRDFLRLEILEFLGLFFIDIV